MPTDECIWRGSGMHSVTAEAQSRYVIATPRAFRSVSDRMFKLSCQCFNKLKPSPLRDTHAFNGLLVIFHHVLYIQDRVNTKLMLNIKIYHKSDYIICQKDCIWLVYMAWASLSQKRTSSKHECSHLHMLRETVPSITLHCVPST